MHWDVFADAALARWTGLEHPDDALRDRVLTALHDLADRKDFTSFCVAYRDDGEHYELMVEGTRTFIEFRVFDELAAIYIMDISTASLPR